MVAGHLEPALVSGPVPEVLQACLVNHPPDDLFLFGAMLALLLSWYFQETILLGMQRQCDWVITKDGVDVSPI